MTSVGDKIKRTNTVLRPNKTVLPLIAVGGSRGKSTVSWLIASIMRASGASVANWISSGVYVDGERLEGELRPWSRVLLAAKYGEIDAVIQELEAAVVVGAGIPSRTYPMAVLTTICGNDESCRLSMSTELEERSIGMILSAVREDGCVVANADDLGIVAATHDAKSDLILFALHPENPVLQKHLNDGGHAVWLENGTIVEGDRQSVRPVLDIAEIPATLDGALLFQVQNAMAATAAALHLGLDCPTIAHGLRSFQPLPSIQPGACNILEAKGARVVIDSPEQTWTLKMLARGIRQQPHRRSVVVSGSFPTLNLEDAREAGRILGGLGGVVILHDEGDEGHLRAIKAGIASNPVPPLVMVMGSESAAIGQMITTLKAGDMALVLSRQPDSALEQVFAYS
jgi:cyanophycin synthetase